MTHFLLLNLILLKLVQKQPVSEKGQKNMGKETLKACSSEPTLQLCYPRSLLQVIPCSWHRTFPVHPPTLSLLYTPTQPPKPCSPPPPLSHPFPSTSRPLPQDSFPSHPRSTSLLFPRMPPKPPDPPAAGSSRSCRPSPG